MPEEDGPRDVQPDTWVQPVQGVAALGRAQRVFQGRALQSALLWQTPEDPTGAVEPDTWTQDIQGTSAVRLASRLFQRHAGTTLLYFQTAEDLTSAVPPSTCPPLILVNGRLARRLSGIVYILLE